MVGLGTTRGAQHPWTADVVQYTRIFTGHGTIPEEHNVVYPGARIGMRTTVLEIENELEVFERDGRTDVGDGGAIRARLLTRICLLCWAGHVERWKRSTRDGTHLVMILGC